MKAAVIGGGPAGLFFAALLRKIDPRHEVTVYERNRLDDTFGFGVVFSDATEEALVQADREVTEAMAVQCHRWDDIEIHYRGSVLTSTGHGFSGLSRTKLLGILSDRCRGLGARLCLEREVRDPETLRDADLVVIADGVNSPARERYAMRSARPPTCGRTGSCGSAPRGRFRPSRSTSSETATGSGGCTPTSTNERSTFIDEASDQTWRAAGMDLDGREPQPDADPHTR